MTSLVDNIKYFGLVALLTVIFTAVFNAALQSYTSKMAWLTFNIFLGITLLTFILFFIGLMISIPLSNMILHRKG